jgi:hypothetical protein
LWLMEKWLPRCPHLYEPLNCKCEWTLYFYKLYSKRWLKHKIFFLIFSFGTEILYNSEEGNSFPSFINKVLFPPEFL